MLETGMKHEMKCRCECLPVLFVKLDVILIPFSAHICSLFDFLLLGVLDLTVSGSSFQIVHSVVFDTVLSPVVLHSPIGKSMSEGGLEIERWPTF
jgi:hypothetical protein